MHNNDNSGVNTILIIAVLVIAVAGVVWFLMGGANESPEAGMEVDITLPVGESAE